MSSRDSTGDEGKKPVVEQQHVSPAGKLPFDVVVVAEGDARKNLTPEEFFALPLAERIKFVVQQRASFFAEGRAVDAREVLSQMRKMRAQLH